MQSCRKVFDKLDLTKGENASLLMARYVKNLDDNNSSKLDLYEAMKDAAFNSKDLYTQAFNIRHKALSNIASSKSFKTLGTIIAGLGSSNVLETGLTLNPTYGIPMIPGSSIKGVTAHYCSKVFGPGKVYDTLFGKVSDEHDEQEAGFLQFYDAWLIPESVKDAFVDDVMTPHHSDYYSGKSARPTDFDDPTPIRFLSVSGTFEVWIGCYDSEWRDFAFRLTEDALKNFGIGGKITSSYGKMECVLSLEEREEQERRKKQKANREAGFFHDEGEIVTVICTNVTEKKKKVKREFAFTENSDNKPIHFSPGINANVGETITTRIIQIEQTKTNNAYILQKL